MRFTRGLTMDKAPILTTKLNLNNPRTRSAWEYPTLEEQRDSDHEYYMKRIQTLEASLDDVKNQHESKCKECQAWHDGALDWRESEIAKAVKAERTDNKCG